MSSKLQIVAKQSGKTELADELNRISVCNNPTMPSWTVPDGSFIPSDFGVLMITVNGHGAEEVKSPIAELTLQAIKYAIHETSDDWNKMTELDVLESAIYFAHEQIIGFKRSNPEFNEASADVSIALIKNHKIYLSWIGKGGIFKYSEKSFDAVTGSNCVPALELLTKVPTPLSVDKEDEPLVLSFDESVNFDTQYTDELGVPAYLPMIKTKIESVYQNDIILGLTDGMIDSEEEKMLELIESNISSSNQIVNCLLARIDETGQREGVVICKVVQGKQLVLPVRKSIPSLAEEPGAHRDSSRLEGKKSRFVLNAFVIMLVVLVIVAQWHFGREGVSGDQTVSASSEDIAPEEKVENLILLMADESELGLISAKNQQNSEEVNYLDGSNKELPHVIQESMEISELPNLQKREVVKMKYDDESENIKSAGNAEKESSKKETAASDKMNKGVKDTEVIKKNLEANPSGLQLEFMQLKEKVNIMVDWDEEVIKSQKNHILRIVDEGLSELEKTEPSQSDKLDKLLKNASDEFRKLQRLVTQRLYEGE